MTQALCQNLDLEAAQPVRIGRELDLDNLAVKDCESEYDSRNATGDPCRSGLAIDKRQLGRLGLAVELLGHGGCSVKFRGNPTVFHAHPQRRLVTSQCHVGIEHRQQRLKVACARCLEECRDDVLMAVEVCRAAIFRFALHASASTAGELARGDRSASDNAGNFLEGHAEDIVQHKRDTLGG